LTAPNTDGTTTEPEKPAVTVDDAGTQDGGGAGEAIVDPVPLKSLTKLRAKNQAVEAELAALKATAKAAADAAAVEQGEFKALFEASKPKADKYDALVESLKTRNTERVEALDADWQAAIPATLKADPVALDSWLDQTAALRKPKDAAAGTEEPETKRPAGARTGTGGPVMTEMPEQAKKDARAAGKTDEEWWAIANKMKRYEKKQT
jgi:hypothetical protein